MTMPGMARERLPARTRRQGDTSPGLRWQLSTGAVAMPGSFAQHATLVSVADINVEDVAMRSNPIEISESVVPYAPARARAAGPAPARGETFSHDDDTLEKSGQSVMALLQQAGTTVKDNLSRALRVAHGLSLQLRAAEDKIKTLEAELRQMQDQSARAQNWMQRISSEIEAKFLEPIDADQQHDPARRNGGPYSGRV